MVNFPGPGEVANDTNAADDELEVLDDPYEDGVEEGDGGAGDAGDANGMGAGDGSAGGGASGGVRGRPSGIGEADVADVLLALQGV